MQNEALSTKQLILTAGVNIFVDESVLELILRNFDPNKKIAVHVAAGKVGTGKSSFLNVIIKSLLRDLNIAKKPFEVKDTSNTLTQGVWVSTHPYTIPNHPDVQLLIVDLEGMFGLKKENLEDTMMNLMKIYLFGMLISSVFVIHAMNKIDSETISILKRAFEICKKLQKGLQVDPPEMYLLLKDIDLSDQDQDIQEVIEKIEEHLSDYDEERARLHIRGRGDVPKSFKKTNSKDCSELRETKYLEVIDELILATAKHPKTSAILQQNRPITIQEFGLLVKKICTLLNEKDMEAHLLTAIDYVKVERMSQLYNEHLKRCADECQDKAMKESLETSLDSFKGQVAALTDKHIAAFEQEVIASLRNSETIRVWVDNQKTLFQATIKAMNFIEIFGNRKVVAEANEAQKRIYEKQLEQERDASEKARQSMIDYENKMKAQMDAHKEDLRRMQDENEAKIMSLAREKIEELNKRLEAESKHREELASLHKTHANDIANINFKLTEKWDELVKQQIEMRIQEEKILKESKAERERLMKILEEDREKHRIAIDNLTQQLLIVAAQKPQKRKRRGLLGFVNNVVFRPLGKLATGIVKGF